MSSRTVLLDTSFVIALDNRQDDAHSAAKALDSELLSEKAMLLLHWGIITEIADGYARLDRRRKGMELIERFLSEEEYEIAPVTNDLFERSIALYLRRQDKEWSLTDCISFTLMADRGINEALTADRHFVQAGHRALLIETP